MFQIPLPIYPTYRILNRNKTNLGTKITVMIPISKKEEKRIDDIGKSTLRFTRGNRTFSVKMSDVYCYGEIDFTDRNTLKEIAEFNFLNNLGAVGVSVYSRYDYDTHSCTSPNKYCLWSETWNPVILTKMAHGFLGKPERILLFNQTIKK